MGESCIIAHESGAKARLLVAPWPLYCKARGWCGETVELREHPKACDTKACRKLSHAGQGNALGYGKSAQDATMGYSQPSSLAGRAAGEGSETRWRSVGGFCCTTPPPRLKIESNTAERQPQEERLEQGPELADACSAARSDRLGGAWPFLVGGLPCQVDSGNERDLSLLNSDDCQGSRATS